MYRFLAVLLTIILINIPAFQSMGQATRYRLPTGAENERAPSSFRGFGKGVEGQGQMGMPGMRMPSSGLGSSGAGEGAARMMGSGYNVHVLGEVSKPGTYFVPASARLAQAIQLAGGISENGSERNIELRRKGGRKKHVDLLHFKLQGKLKDNPYLADNDVVFVPLRDKVIQVAGAVKRPRVYEIKSERTLKNAIDLAGGFNNAMAKDEPIRVIRFKDGKKDVVEVNSSDEALSKFKIQSGDVIVVSNVITKDTKFDYNVASIPGDRVFYPSYEDRVFVLGGVAFPGAYPFSPYYTLSQYISLAGGQTELGKDKYKITGLDGKNKRAKLNDRVNPGDTIMVEQRVMSSAGWAGFALSVASFGLSASSTVIAISR